MSSRRDGSFFGLIALFCFVLMVGFALKLRIDSVSADVDTLRQDVQRMLDLQQQRDDFEQRITGRLTAVDVRVSDVEARMQELRHETAQWLVPK